VRIIAGPPARMRPETACAHSLSGEGVL